MTHNPTDLPDEVRSAANYAGMVLGDSWTARDIGGHFTCTEAEALADLLRAVGEGDAAERFIAGHAESDEPGDFHHPDTEDYDDEPAVDLAVRELGASLLAVGPLVTDAEVEADTLDLALNAESRDQ